MANEKPHLNGEDLKAISKIVRNEVRTEVSIQLDTKLKEFSEEVDRKLNKQLSDFYDRVDAMIKEFRDNEDERTMRSEKISNHEDRLENLERAVNTI